MLFGGWKDKVEPGKSPQITCLPKEHCWDIKSSHSSWGKTGSPARTWAKDSGILLECMMVAGKHTKRTLLGQRNTVRTTVRHHPCDQDG